MKMVMTGQMRLEQRMKLAPRMIQSMEVLQLPLLALQEKIEAELNSNPVLETAEEREEADGEGDAGEPAGGEGDGEEPAGEAAGESDETVEERELVVGDEKTDRADDFERLDQLEGSEAGFTDYLESAWAGGPRRSAGEPDKKLEALQNTAAQEASLNDSLNDQWRLVDAAEPVKEAGRLIIDYIDEKGYLAVRLEQLHNKDKHAFGIEHLHAALDLVQKLEPAGVGARDLKECLLIQMRSFPDNMRFESQLVEEHWDELLENKLPQIARKMKCTLEEINAAVARMSKLDTSPGLGIGRDDNHPITADIIVEARDDGGYSVRLTDTSVPNLRVSRFYTKMARDRQIDQKTREFLLQNIRTAQWFMEAIEQRKHTLLRVAEEVVDHQREFFDKGRLYLKPLPMAAVAGKVGVHIATVSRAVAGKYMQCPQGVLALRSFFNGGMENAAGEAHSWDAVKAKLQQIVDEEDKSHPLNDDDIREKLAESGMGDIARRTVAKYRKTLNIATARFRKKY
jgi:RNA polymerase sigma-54 factor